PTGYQLMPGKNCHLSVPKTSSLCIFRSLEPSVRTLTPLKWRSVLTVKTNVINRLLKTRSIMQERQGAEREVQCLLKIGILARDRALLSLRSAGEPMPEKFPLAGLLALGRGLGKSTILEIIALAEGACVPSSFGVYIS